MFDAGIFLNLSGLLLAQPVSFQQLVEKFWCNEEIGPVQPGHGIRQFYQPLLSGTLQQANGADGRQTQLPGRLDRKSVV